jgi:hypothetical protein
MKSSGKRASSISESESFAAWSNNANHEVIPFHMVDRDFVCKVGMKIGIVVYSNVGADLDDALSPQNQLEAGVHLEDIFGQPRNVMIFTGGITEVGSEYFEHDINTFPGCSGAIVFLLDNRQPAFVSRDDYKKAIGVHVGYKPGLRTNIAFMLGPTSGPTSSPTSGPTSGPTSSPTVLEPERSKWWWWIRCLFKN